MAKRATLTTTAGARLPTTKIRSRRPSRPAVVAGLPAGRKACAPEPRAHPRAYRACQRLGRFRNTDDHRGHLEIHQGKSLRRAPKTDMLICASRPWPANWRGRRRARRSRLRFEVLTEEGNWDLVGNNTPVFFVRDPYKFPDFIHTQKRHPQTNMRSPDGDVGFLVAVSPESLHQVTILMSDRGLPIRRSHEWLRQPHLQLL